MEEREDAKDAIVPVQRGAPGKPQRTLASMLKWVSMTPSVSPVLPLLKMMVARSSIVTGRVLPAGRFDEPKRGRQREECGEGFCCGLMAAPMSSSQMMTGPSGRSRLAFSMNARLVTMVRSWACRTAGFKSGLADG